MDRPAEWDRRWWSPIINAEHLALRDRVGLVENPAFAVFDVTGPGALAWLQWMAVGQVDVPVGKLVYTQLLNQAGGIRADIVVMRLGWNQLPRCRCGVRGQRRQAVADGPPARRGWCELRRRDLRVEHDRDLGTASA